jgi:hypothetical protein
MLTLADRSYIPQIKSFCGTFLEVEQITPIHYQTECKNLLLLLIIIIFFHIRKILISNKKENKKLIIYLFILK